MLMVVLQSTRGYHGIQGTTGSTGGYCGIMGGTGSYYWVPCSMGSYPSTPQCPAGQNSTE